MKTKILLAALLLTPFAALGQANPPPVSAFTYSAGSWMAAATTATAGQISYQPPAAALYCYNLSTGKWVPADSSCFGGGGSTLSLTSPTSTLTLSPSPITGTGTLDLNLAHANTWTGQQTFVAPALGTPASGVLTNATGLPAASVLAGALANGMTATTQTAGDNTTKVATDAFVIANAGGGGGSPKVIYASQIAGVTAGIAVVAGSSATGTTDSASAINTAIASGNVDLEVDSGFALSTSLVLHSNTIVHCTSPQYGFIMQTASNVPVFVNANQNAPTTASGTGGYLVSNQTDNNIQILGCMINANSTQAVTGSGNAFSTPHTTNPSTGLLVFALQFIGVNGFTVSGNEIYDPGTYSIDASNMSNEVWTNNYAHQPQPLVHFKNTGTFGIEGPSSYVEVSGNRIQAGDDSIEIATEGCARAGVSYCQIPNTQFGPIQHVHIEHNTFVNSDDGVRLLDASELIDDIDIGDTQGVTNGLNLIAVTYSALNTFGLGNIGRVNIHGWKVYSLGTYTGAGTQGVMVLGLNAQDFTINDVQYANPAVTWPLLYVSPSQGVTQNLNLHGWGITTSSSTFSDIFTMGASSVVNLLADNFIWNDSVGTGLNFSGISGAHPTTFTCSNYGGRGAQGTTGWGGYGSTTNVGDCFNYLLASGISGATSGQALIAGSATTATSSKALAGGGAALTTGPTSSTGNDLTTFSGSSGQIQDSGVLLTAIPAVNIASGSLANGMAATTQIGGDSTTKLATTAFVQAAIAAAGTGAGIVTYSGPSLTFSGTQYLPIGGGGLASTTETNVDIDSPAAVTIQNMTVQMSAAPGVGNSVVYTWRKNASSQTLTCTISGASATSCSDTTHSFTTASLDLLDIQAVTTGTIVGTPTVIMAAQVGISAATSTAFSAISGGTNTGNTLTVGNSSSVTPSGTGVVNANQVNGAIVPASQTSLATNSSGQIVAGSGGYPAPVTLTASSSAELDFTTCVTSSFRDYQIRFSDLLPASTSQNVFVQVSTNGGSTYDTTSGHYTVGYATLGLNQSSAFTGNTGPISVTGFYLSGFGSTTPATISGTLTIFNLSASTTSKRATLLLDSDGSPESIIVYGGERYTQTAAVNAIRVIAGSGNLASGSVTCQPLPQ